MRILIAEDDVVSRRVLEATLRKWGHEVISTWDGELAWNVLGGDDAPQLAILDWMMPGADGVELCRRLRAREGAAPVYIILLTAKGTKGDTVEGLDAGADDYVTKPFNREELQARVRVGERVVALQNALAVRVRELEGVLAQVKRLEGILPICSYCKCVRGDENYWQRVESYIAERSEARFSHGICPDCYEQKVKPQLEALRARREGSAG